MEMSVQGCFKHFRQSLLNLITCTRAASSTLGIFAKSRILLNLMCLDTILIAGIAGGCTQQLVYIICTTLFWDFIIDSCATQLECRVILFVVWRLSELVVWLVC